MLLFKQNNRLLRLFVNGIYKITNKNDNSAVGEKLGCGFRGRRKRKTIQNNTVINKIIKN